MKAVLQFFHYFYQSVRKKGKGDWEVIFYCILVSGLFWFLNAMGKVYHHTLSIPVEYRYDQNSCIPVSNLPDHVKVQTEGRGWNMLRAIWARTPSVLQISVEKPLSTLAIVSGSWQPELRAMLPYLKLEQVITDSIPCRFDPIESREVTLIADLKDFNLKPGYRIASPVKITPGTVKFTGAASLIRSLPPQLTVPVSGNNVQESFDQNISLEFQGDYSRSELLNYGPESVNIHFNVRSALEDEREVPIRLLNADRQPGLYLKEEKVTVNYLVSIPDREKIQLSEFRLVADMLSFNPADSTLELSLEKWPAIVSDANPAMKKIRVYGR